VRIHHQDQKVQEVDSTIILEQEERLQVQDLFIISFT